MSEYKNYSRRGLIALGNDYDRDNDNALHHYLMEHEDDYEGVRPVEKVIEKVDTGIETISNSGYCIKQTVCTEGKKIIDSAKSIIAVMPDVIEVGKAVVNAIK